MSEIYTLCELKNKYNSLSSSDQLVYSAKFDYFDGLKVALNSISKHDCFLRSGIIISNIFENDNYVMMNFFINYLFENNIFNSNNISKLRISKWLAYILIYNKNIMFLKIFSKHTSKDELSDILYDAVCYNSIEKIKFLIDNGADIYYENNSTFKYAVKQKLYNIILLFINCGLKTDDILDEEVRKKVNILLRNDKLKKICLDIKN